MAIKTISFLRRGFNDHAKWSLDALTENAIDALVITDANADFEVDEYGKYRARLPWFDRLGRFVPDQMTTVAGTERLPDMPAHIDPHAKDSLKALMIIKGLAVVSLVGQVPVEFLDETNELPGNDYAPLTRAGYEVDKTVLGPGDVAFFYGSTTLHEVESISERFSLINGYSPRD